MAPIRSKYSKYKIFHFKEKVDSLPASVKKILPPIHIRIKPTNVCNHRCWYCAYRADNLQLGKDMIHRDFIPEEKMLEIIDDLDEVGVKAVTFSGGGDPFCYSYLGKAAEKLSNTNIKFSALTNGSRLEGEMANVFANNATWIRISMDGWDDESYSYYRGVKNGEFTKIINNIKNFKKISDKCHIGVSIIIDKKNSGHFYDLIRKLRDIGVNSVKISPCITSNDGSQNNEYHRPIFDNVKKLAQKAIDDFSDRNFEIFDSYHALDDKFDKDYDWCPYLQILSVIGADLNIYPCQDKAYNLEEGLIGSIKNQRFKDFWFSDKSQYFKINPSKVCNHHCVANEKNKMILEYVYTDKDHNSFV